MTSEQRVAVVTGGTGAIGGAIVTALDTAGYRTVVLGRRAGDVLADLASESATKRAAAEVLDRYGRVDVLVHCAAVIDPMPLSDLDAQRWRTVQAVNVEAPLWLAQAFTPGMAERTFGRIVFVAVDLGADGIAVTAVAPGLTDTPIARSVNDPGQIEAVVATQAMKRALTPEDTANAVAFLASAGAEALTGQVLVVDGGSTMR
jgi:3-oxoacyl-[acyl-carrier protein] reductase